jgi:hypothetical protein
MSALMMDHREDSMPRNVRNFWIELDVDGRRNNIETGPVRKDGGFSETIRIRNRGSISSTTLEIRGYVDSSGEVLSLSAAFVSRSVVGSIATQGQEIKIDLQR